jgi:cytochrome c5
MGHLLLAVAVALAAGCAISQEWRREYEAATDPIVKGRILYENSCNRCHALYMPESYTRGDWRFYVRKYSPRARLTADESALVLGYLRAHARNARPRE